MNKLITYTGGKPNFNIDDILWNDDAYRLAITAILKAFGGDNFIVQGCTKTGGTLNAGYIMLDGELLQVESHTFTSTHFVKVTTYDAGGNVTFNDGNARQIWQKNRATLTAGSGNLAYSDNARMLKTKIVEIGDWDMDTDATKTVTHGITNYKNIRSVSVIIREDSDANYYNLLAPNGLGVSVAGMGVIDSTVINLGRANGSIYDSTSFNSTSFNRGWVTIEYFD